MKKLYKIVLVEVVFLMIATAFIPAGLFTDSYLPKHRYPDKCLIEGVCQYDNDLSTFIANWKDLRNESKILTIIPDTSDDIIGVFGSGHIFYFLADILSIIFWILLLNSIHLFGQKILNKSSVKISK